jgi:hypothetical protein
LNQIFLDGGGGITDISDCLFENDDGSGLSIDSATGVITVGEAEIGAYNVEVQCTETSSGFLSSNAFTINILDPT